MIAVWPFLTFRPMRFSMCQKCQPRSCMEGSLVLVFITGVQCIKYLSINGKCCTLRPRSLANNGANLEFLISLAFFHLRHIHVKKAAIKRNRIFGKISTSFYSWYIRTLPPPHFSISALPEAVGWVNATSPRRGFRGQPCTKVAAAASSRRRAMPRLWYAEGTNIRGMPIGVDRSSGLQNRLELVSTETRRAVAGGKGFASEDPWTSAGEAMAMAVDMWVAITQPVMVSHEADLADGRRKR